MGRSRYKVINESAHFLTCTVIRWLALFTDPEMAMIVLNAMNYLQQQHRWRLYGYVVMENHLHLIAEASNLSKEIANFKSFTARTMIDCLKAKKHYGLLEQLSVHKIAHKQDRDYQLWQEGSHPERIQNENMLKEKLEYMHNNPVRRGYVDEPAHWRYSSARNYVGMEGILPLEGIVIKGDAESVRRAVQLRIPTGTVGTIKGGKEESSKNIYGWMEGSVVFEEGIIKKDQESQQGISIEIVGYLYLGSGYADQ